MTLSNLRRALHALLLLAAVLVPSVSDAQTPIIVCLSGPGCQAFPDTTVGDATFADLQDALDYVSTWPHRNTEAFIYIAPGLYTNANSPTHQAVANAVWRPRCESRSGYTGFRLYLRGAPTTIEGTGNQPSDVVIWAKVPDHIVEDPVGYVWTWPYYKIFHGFGFHVNQPVTLSNVSVVSDGGFTENGAGDATLYVKTTDLTLEDSLVLANLGPSNCLRTFSGDEVVPGPIFDDLPILHDQEGIVVDAGNLTMVRTVVGDNVHTGVMVINGGTAMIADSAVRHNGFDDNHFEAIAAGHGVTSFHHSTQAACFGGDTRIDVDQSEVIDNSGIGVLLRGNFSATAQLISDSDLRQNTSWDLAVTGSWDPGITSLSNGSTIQALGNQYDAGTPIRIEDVTIDAASSITLDAPYSLANVTGSNRIFGVTVTDGTPWDSQARWAQLQAVGALVGGQARVCP